MNSRLERLAGPGQPLTAEPPEAAEFEGAAEPDERLVEDLIAACHAVAAKREQLSPL